MQLMIGEIAASQDPTLAAPSKMHFFSASASQPQEKLALWL